MIEPSKLYTIAKKYEDENLKFRSFLKNRADHDELDEQFLELHNELFSRYDCRGCGNCCRVYRTTVRYTELGPIAAFLGLSERDFADQYLTETIEGSEYELVAPCRFLDDNGACAIQACKPVECRDFPHTNKPGRLESLLGVLSFAEVCPVVFEILQRLKRVYRFKGLPL